MEPTMARRQVAYSFDHHGSATTAAIRGGKGASLEIMTGLGLPVPPGFTLDSGVCRAYTESVKGFKGAGFPVRVYGQIAREIEKLEKRTGLQFGDPDNPLLVSVRSGAQLSMPGMMDTILNVGIDPMDLGGLTRRGGKRFARNTRSRFERQYAAMLGHSITREEIPRNPYDQLYAAIYAVFDSWNSERAVLYRAENKIPNWWGTAVTVQAMVFGNIDQESCTGVVFSNNVATGEEGLYGEFLTKAQGEDVVSGIVTPRPIAEMREWNSDVYCQLENYVLQLAKLYNDVVDVEFTVEQGRLYILQSRAAKKSPLATATIAVRDVWSGKITTTEAVNQLSKHEVQQLSVSSFDIDPNNPPQLFGRGLAASPGVATGYVAFSSVAAQDYAKRGLNAILVRHATSPEDLSGMLAAKAVVTFSGGETCHAAVVARAQGLPAVVSVVNPPTISDGEVISVDGTTGTVYVGDLPFKETRRSKHVTIFLKWWRAMRGYKPVIKTEFFSQHFNLNQQLTDFYLSDVMALRTKCTPFAQAAADLRERVHNEVAEVMITYLSLVITREIRHVWNHLHKTLTEHELAIANAIETALQIRGCVSGSVPRFFSRYIEKHSIEEFTALVGHMVTLFGLNGWSSSYGGERWKMIAEAVFKFLTGEWSPTIFVDHAFDLRHNGGVMFNKHAMVDALTDEPRLSEQLTIKLAAPSPGGLFAQLTRMGKPTDEVCTLWHLCQSEGLLD